MLLTLKRSLLCGLWAALLLALAGSPAQATGACAGGICQFYLPQLYTPRSFNLLQNSEFDDDGAPWRLGTWGEAQAEWRINIQGLLSGDSSAQIDIFKAASAAWQVQLRQSRSIQAGRIYQIHFKGFARPTARAIQLVVQQDNDPWTVHWSYPISLSASAWDYGPIYFCSPLTDNDTNLEFYLGDGGPGRVYLDLVEMYDVTRVTPTDDLPGELWDDFAYNYWDDCRLAQNGWSLRRGSGPPGEGEPAWKPENITFYSNLDYTYTWMRLSASNQGSNSVSSQAQINTQAHKFQYGTYAARVHWNDWPDNLGLDGDQVVQAFYAITEGRPCSDPNYSEQDFEYLPNGGFGLDDGQPRLWHTTWEQCEPVEIEATHHTVMFPGAHILVLQVQPEVVRYWVDGQLLSEHRAGYSPETPQTINFNIWFSGRLPDPALRAYAMDVDWVYFRQDEILSPDQVVARVADLRNLGVLFKDTVPTPP